LRDAGVQVVGDVTPYEHRKLWLLNGPHSALAYCGLLAGCTTIAEAVTHTTVARFVRALVDDALAGADLPAALDPEAFAADALRRFRNPALGHTCVQVGTDGSRKLPQRYPDLILARRKHGLPTTRFAVVVAAWIAAVTALPVQGVILPAVEDPAAEALRAALASGGLDAVSRIALPAADAVFAGEVRDALERLQRDGAAVLEVSV
jgi:fructuronate reductase